MGDTTAVIAVSRGAPLRIVASHSSGEHRHRLVVRGDSPLRQPKDLVGKRLGVKKGTSTFGGLLAFLAARRIAPESLEIVDLRPDEMPEALMAGSVDAFVASEPTPSLAEARGARELATLGGLNNAYPIMILARTGLLESRQEEVCRLLRALDRAEAFIAGRPEETAALLARATGLAPETARRAMGRHDYRLRLDREILSSLEDTGRFLKGQGIIEAVPDVAGAAAPECLDTVRREPLEHRPWGPKGRPPQRLGMASPAAAVNDPTLIRYDERFVRGGEFCSDRAAESLRAWGIPTVISVTPNDREREFCRRHGLPLVE